MTIEIHVCAECVHFLPESDLPDPEFQYARCQAKFDVNLVTGSKRYLFCNSIRNNPTCGNYEKFEVNYG